MELSEPHAPQAVPNAPITPMLRTVLLCDIVESTALVERLGDMRAVALFQQHDQLLRHALSLCNGLLIDKADGVLALFERPIQALDFALRYQRGLRELGEKQGLELKARIGLHVGDVMTWANAPKDVLAGAKAFEVEGLAKPVAARLMNLALPGQILMSGMAQNLCQRAVAELGDAGARLRWLLHGRYNFKGVPAPMLVHEVGEPGLSPLRAPESGAKAWRELPLWRRPPVVALQVLLVGSLVTALFWSTLRSPPAIAFAERDWVVVADLQNRTDQPVFDDGLDTALRIGLEQSRHVNLISELQIDRALERMQRQGQPVDRQLANELALREGAKAVILPTIAQVGSVVRVSLEVVDPSSGVTVYSESVDGRGAADVLPALDAASAKVRGKLGEALASIQNSSKPLEQVTTDDLEALKAFSMALKMIGQAKHAEAQALLGEAIRLDPQFAMAYLRMAFLRYSNNDADGTRHFLDLALANREHLSQREGLFLDGAEATLTSPELALEKFKLLATLYPDEFRAYYNYAYFAHFDALRSADGLELIAPALVAQNSRRDVAHFQAGILHLALNQYAQAVAEFERSESLGHRGFKREYVEAHLAQRQYALAERVHRLQAANGLSSHDIEMRLVDVSLPLDQGRYAAALQSARKLEAEAAATDVSDLTRWNQAGITLLLRSYAPDAEFGTDLRAYAQSQADSIPGSDSLRRRHVLFHAIAAGWMAAFTGDAATARDMVAATVDDPMTQAYPANAAMLRVLQAEMALAEGQPGKAIQLLGPTAASGQGLYLERAVLMRALAAAGNTEAALVQADWLAANRGRAFVESSSLGMLQAANVIESSLALRAGSRLAVALKRPQDARERQAAFEQAWGGDGHGDVTARRDLGF